MNTSDCRRWLIFKVLAALLLLLPLFSCVHEWPEAPCVRGAKLVVRHELPWQFFDYNYKQGTRVGKAEPVAVRYIYEVYPEGSTEEPVARYTQVRTDLSLADFTTTLELPAGVYDVYVWSDFIDRDTGRSLYYDATSLSAVKVLTPYAGDTDLKDAFQGMFTASVPSSVDESVSVECEVTLRRPLTAYAFLSTDLEEFIEQETRRTGLPVMNESGDVSQSPSIDFSRYRVRMRYPGYLPVEYSVFRNRPTDSATGLYYEGNIKVISNEEVLLGFDYFFINGHESSVNVGIDIIDPQGETVASAASVTVPVERNRVTIVRGDFLTSKAHGGIGINPDFDGDYNIEIK